MAAFTIRQEIERLEKRIEGLKALVADPNNGLGMDDTLCSSLTLGRVDWINKNDGQRYVVSV